MNNIRHRMHWIVQDMKNYLHRLLFTRVERYFLNKIAQLASQYCGCNITARVTLLKSSQYCYYEFYLDGKPYLGEGTAMGLLGFAVSAAFDEDITTWVVANKRTINENLNYTINQPT